MIQVNLNLINTHVACTLHDTFFILHIYRYVCAHKIDNIEAFIYTLDVWTIICMSMCACYVGMYMTNLLHMHFDMHINWKPRMMV